MFRGIGEPEDLTNVFSHLPETELGLEPLLLGPLLRGNVMNQGDEMHWPAVCAPNKRSGDVSPDLGSALSNEASFALVSRTCPRE